ncbi:MAG: hypothetical protein JNN30_10820 [Rhodanobacteraceae bacterium]|nr:hypothetical protein [Rhodanobacteraceae bacterium]
MSGLDAEAASFVAKLEQAYPEFRIVAPLLRRRAVSLLAFEGIAHELTQATFHLPDATVAASKLQWWREEFARHAAGEARHPLVRSLGPVACGRLEPTVFDVLIGMAQQLRDAAPASDFVAQCRQITPAFAAIERLRVTMLGSAEQSVSVQADLAAATYLLRVLARLPLAQEEMLGSAISMQLLARYQLSRSELAVAGATRDTVVRAQVAAIADRLAELGPMVDASATWLAKVRWWCECWRARPLGSGDPFAVLWARLQQAPWNIAWKAWRAQRRES